MNIQNAILTAHRRWGLFPLQSRTIVGVSGGADSLALLHALAHLRSRLGIEIHVATLDHRLRGAASAADADYVVQVATAWQVPVTRGQADVPALAEGWGLGIEDSARRARYAFLAATADAQGASRVAVAHHADDQAETVLHHLLRGAGMDGLAAMRPTAALHGRPELTLVRPLLGVSRADIDAYCARHAILPRTDVTNTDTTQARNWIRHTLLPLIQTRYPGAPRALADLAASAAPDVEWMTGAAQALLGQAHREPRAIHLNRRLFLDAPEALRSRYVRLAFHALAPEGELSHERTAAVCDLFAAGHRGQRVELPAGVWAATDRDRVTLERIRQDVSQAHHQTI